MHDVIYAIVAAVIVVGGGGSGVAVARRRRAGATSPSPSPTGPAAPPRPGSGPRSAPGPTRPSAAGPSAAGPEAGSAPAVAPVVEVEPEAPEEAVADLVPGGTVARPRLRDSLGKARSLFGGYLSAVRSRQRIDAGTWEELEEALILADVGTDVTASILDELRNRVELERMATPDQLVDGLRSVLIERLGGDRELHLVEGVTNVWLFVGVNGVGKTTTIGKIGRRSVAEGRSVIMAAGDTFRAAAADQLASWGERTGVEVIRGNEGGDPGAVIFDAVQHGAARGVDLVLADTAGRLHTKVNLMAELQKVRRVAARPPGQVSEVLLVIDATTGQNGLIQARQFAQAVGVTGVVLTKLDGTAKGGIAVAIQSDLGIPIKLVGVGETADDLIEFDPVEFVDALVAIDT